SGGRASPTAFRSARGASFHGSCLRAASSSSGPSAPDRRCCRGRKSEPGETLLWLPAASCEGDGQTNKISRSRAGPVSEGGLIHEPPRTVQIVAARCEGSKRPPDGLMLAP